MRADLGEVAQAQGDRVPQERRVHESQRRDDRKVGCGRLRRSAGKAFCDDQLLDVGWQVVERGVIRRSLRGATLDTSKQTRKQPYQQYFVHFIYCKKDLVEGLF